LAENEITTAAGIALKAVPAVPSHADALSGFPLHDIGADGVNAACNLVPGNARILKSRKLPFLH
jgi:hypothetical protein